MGFFRLFYVDGETYKYTKPLRFCKNPTLPYDEMELNLTLRFVNENNGQYSFNKAEIKNCFDIDLPNCNIRFVMQKGEYIVSGGFIYQTIETDLLSIIDVKVDISAEEEKTIEISKKL